MEQDLESYWVQLEEYKKALEEREASIIMAEITFEEKEEKLRELENSMQRLMEMELEYQRKKSEMYR